MRDTTPILPQDLDIERVILGAVLIREDAKLFETIRRELESAAFTTPFHREVFLALCALIERGDAINPMICAKEMEDRGSSWKLIDIMARIAEMSDGVPRLSDLTTEIRRLKNVATRREIIRCAEAWQTEAQARDVDVSGLVRAMINRADDFWQQCAEPETGDFPLEPGFYASLADFDAAEFETADDVMIGVRRRQVTLFLSVTNAGKTTIMLNHCLAAAAGRKFDPLLPDALERPLKVVYFDAESTADELQRDIKTMLRTIGGRDEALVNFIPVVEATVKGSPLNLSDPAHFEYVRRFLQHVKPDIAVFDTISSLFTLFNENDNAEVARKVSKPLKELATAGKCAAVASHHIGKRGESLGDEEEAYLGRGASAFGALARSVFTLKKEKALGNGYVRLSLPKAKGTIFEPVTLRLDFSKRTFDLCEAAPSAETPYQKVVGAFNGQPLKKADLLTLLSGLTERTVERCLTLAIQKGDLEKAGQGKYQKPAPKPVSATSATPYRDGGNGGTPEPEQPVIDRLDWGEDPENDVAETFDDGYGAYGKEDE